MKTCVHVLRPGTKGTPHFNLTNTPRLKYTGRAGKREAGATHQVIRTEVSRATAGCLNGNTKHTIEDLQNKPRSAEK